MRLDRFVQPKVVRLQLADVHRRALAQLRKDGVTENKKARPATSDELARAERKLAQAEADGDWIDIKRELNSGEARHAFARTVKQATFGEPALIDPEQVGRSRIVEYIIGWSFVDADGQPVPYSEAALDNLDVESFAEIREAIEAHEAELEREKNAPTPANT